MCEVTDVYAQMLIGATAEVDVAMNQLHGRPGEEEGLQYGADWNGVVSEERSQSYRWIVKQFKGG
ncbi:uncharacterized protein N7477_002391 [Penicillium maclennaniae]|uniref:uncharacterized protein n=1 Tax=Penicillium maclennaniae TaxID=1343394 RepID=UPI00253F7938|nr:uncharacterized protein N7477_002391 [Penicillium maclennaniae]KAJ5676758.1 hypothetical protein N7477_002391 [Penicillium maclennaniae]